MTDKCNGDELFILGGTAKDQGAMETVCCLARNKVNPNQGIVPPWIIFHAKLLKTLSTSEDVTSGLTAKESRITKCIQYHVHHNKTWDRN